METSETTSESAGGKRAGFGSIAAAWVAFGVVIGVNWAANALPLGGLSTGAISALYPTLLTPAGPAFSIWGILYLWLLGFAVWQSFPSHASASVRGWFIASCAANAGWLLAWHLAPVWTTPPLLAALLLTLVHLTDAARGCPTWVRAGFSLYAGWATLATTINCANALVGLGWTGAPLPPEVWALLVMAVACLIALTVARLRRDILWCVPVAWGLAWVSYARGEGIVSAAAAAAAALLVPIALILVVMARTRDASTARETPPAQPAPD